MMEKRIPPTGLTGIKARVADAMWRSRHLNSWDAAVREVIAAMREPTTEMLRGLLQHRGYDPDAKEETLDRLGQFDVATMGTFIAAYQAMVDEALKD